MKIISVDVVSLRTIDYYNFLVENCSINVSIILKERKLKTINIYIKLMIQSYNGINLWKYY